MESIKKLTAYFRGEVGYLEKETNSHLEDKIANAGDRNYTKYGAYFGHNGPDAYWCDYFVDYCLCQVFGREMAARLLGGLSGYTPTSAGYFKKMGRWHTKDPQEGDIIFFENSVRINHTGYVYKVIGSTVYTIEGNTSSAPGVVRNGGTVAYKEYPVTSTRIAGYGRPDYTLAETPTLKLNCTVALPSLVNGSRGGYVKTLQQLLAARGYSTNGIDGIFGSGTEVAVARFQADAGVKVNYPGTVAIKTWSALLQG